MIVLLLDVPADHPLDLLDVARLPLAVRRHREAGQIDEREVGHVRRVDPEEDRLVRDALLRAGARRRLRLDRRADLRELRRRRVGALQCNRLGRRPDAGREAAKLGAHRRRVGRVDELQRERRARAHLLAEREDVRRHDPVEQRRLAARLRADHDEPRHLWRLNLSLRRRRPEDALERVGDAQHLRAAAHRPQRPALLGRRRRRRASPSTPRRHRDRAAHEVAPRRPDRRAIDGPPSTRPSASDAVVGDSASVVAEEAAGGARRAEASVRAITFAFAAARSQLSRTGACSRPTIAENRVCEPPQRDARPSALQTNHARGSRARSRRDVRVIGAGFGRSGTPSLAAALKELGHKVFRTEDSFENGRCGRPPRRRQIGRRGEGGAATEAAIDAVADRASRRRPTSACTIFDGFLRRYPDAKVILAERATPGCGPSRSSPRSPDDPDRRSRHFLGRADISPLHVWCFEGVGLKLTEPKMLPTVEQAAETVVQWRERVRRTVPKSQLLEFKVTDGWKPLCDFLEVAECRQALSARVVHEPSQHQNHDRHVRGDRLEPGARLRRPAPWCSLLAAFFSCVSSFLPRKARWRESDRAWWTAFTCVGCLWLCCLCGCASTSIIIIYTT